MTKTTPNWAIWLKMPTLKDASQAVALTYGVDPHKVSSDSRGWSYPVGKNGSMTRSIGSFNDRLMLYRACHDEPISPAQLSEWAQSVGWNIPAELAALAPVPVDAIEQVPASQVLEALTSVIPAGADVHDLQNELVTLGVTFTMREGVATVQVPNGTVNGIREPLDSLYHVMYNLFHTLPAGNKLGTLIRGSGASGGGARASTYPSTFTYTEHETHSAPADAVTPAPEQTAETVPAPVVLVPEQIRYDLLATRAELCTAFGVWGLSFGMFKNLTERQWLMDARKVKGQGQRGKIVEPLFCPFVVMRGLATKVKKPKFSEAKGWDVLENRFKTVFEEYQQFDTRDQAG